MQKNREKDHVMPSCKNNPLSDKTLTADLRNHLICKHLNLETIGKMSIASKHDLGFFGVKPSWATLIQDYFGITHEELCFLSKNDANFHYQELFKHRLLLKENELKLRAGVQQCYLAREFRLQLLACCSNNAEFALNVLPQEEDDLWLDVAVCAQADRVYQSLFERNKERYQENIPDIFLQTGLAPLRFICKTGFRPNKEQALTIIRSGNMNSVLFILEPENDFDLRPDNNWLVVAVVSGNTLILEHLVSAYQLKPSLQLLMTAFVLGSQPMIDSITRLLNLPASTDIIEVGHILGKNIISDYLTQIARTGNLTVLRIFIEKLGIKPNELLLVDAAYSGNLAMIEYLIKQCTLELNERVFEQMLRAAAGAGKFELVIHIINHFKVRPDPMVLDKAAQSGNLILVRYLIDAFDLIRQHNLNPDDLIYFDEESDHTNSLLYHYLLFQFVFFRNPLKTLPSCPGNSELHFLNVMHKFSPRFLIHFLVTTLNETDKNQMGMSNPDELFNQLSQLIHTHKQKYSLVERNSMIETLKKLNNRWMSRDIMKIHSKILNCLKTEKYNWTADSDEIQENRKSHHSWSYCSIL